MNAPAGVQLHDLNTPRPITLDPACWEANLTALRRQQPALADKLAAVEIPKHWLPTLALDDWATWRIETDGEPPRWLADSAVPFKRPEALMSTFDPGDLNPSLPGISAGAEARQLLDRMPAFKAVFVFEDDLTHLAAVLRVHDFSAALDAWRLIPIDMNSANADLERLLNAAPGLLPPGNILGLPQHTSEQLRQVQAICLPLVQRTLLERETRLSQVLQDLPPMKEAAGTLLVGFQYSPLVEHAALLWKTAADAAGQPAEIHLLKTPREAHMLALAEQLSTFGPARIACLDHPVEHLPQVLRDRAQAWILQVETVERLKRVSDALNPSQGAESTGTVAYAASPKIAMALSDTQIEPVHRYWAAPIDAEPASVSADGAIVFLDDLPSLTPEAYGIQQPTQKRVFAALLEVLRQAWGSDVSGQPTAYLHRAEQLAQLELTDKTLKTYLLNLIPNTLLPAVIRAELAAEIIKAGRQVVVCGAGWARLDQLPLTIESVSLRWLAQGQQPVAVAISVQPADPLDPAVLWAAARGIPLWLFDPPRSAVRDDLALRLERDAHYRALSHQASAQAALEELSQNWEAVSRRAARAQTHCQASPFEND